MKTIDLHVHSNASDGSYEPATLTRLAIEAGLSAYALTDHDNTNGIKEAQDASFEGDRQLIEVIPGVEISSGYKGRDIHILGLYIDPENQKLNEALALTRKRRDERNHKMVERLNKDGYIFDYDELLFGNPSTIITRGHFSRLLVEKGYARDRADSFARFLNKESRYFVQREYINFEETVKLIHDADGICILAHPLLYNYNVRQIDELVKSFKDCSGDGIEAIYSSNKADDEHFVRSLASKYDLIISGGTDFHGACKPDLKIGTGKGNMSIPYEILENIKFRLNKLD